MKRLRFVPAILAAVCALSSSAVQADVRLTQVVSGLPSPVFVGHAGDGSNRLFIVEQGGFIKVLQPGSSTPTDFLNISAKVIGQGEEGLLGLAFHPQYASNRRFFVFYTQPGDGTLVVAEYRASATNPNVADSTERIFLTIPRPSPPNHNGGMLAFGPDGYLYIGVGDGGAGNDPENDAQNINVLLGKILRIDVDHPDPRGPLYTSPSDNPFVGRDGRDEIFALGLRNPWRFSFDRATGQQWVGDVGQDLLEEVDTPIVKGANYGWRVYEGSQCSFLDPALCGPMGSMPPQFTPPRFEYPHDAGRCSVSGGYVYRGAANVFAGGTYVYGDFCTGEVFGWDGTTQTVLLDNTGLWISSFGEDQQGELYVADLAGGAVYRLDSGSSACTFSVSPSTQSVGAGGGSFNTSVTTAAGCGWTAVANASWLHVTSGSPGSGNGAVGYSVDVNSAVTPRTGTLTIAETIFTVDQAAAPCTYSLTPSGQSVVAAGGTGTTAVGAQTGCTWTAVANASWLHVTSGSSGSGNGTVGYSVDANGTVSSRTGTLTIAGLTFTVDQAAAACTYNISPTSASFGKGGGGGTVTVTATSGCSWTAVSNNPTWITIKSGANGIGNGTVGYAILKNTGRSRSGTIQIAEKTFTVSQK